MLFLVLINTVALSRVTAQHNLTPFGRATQSSILNHAGPENAINPPISNVFHLDHCTHTLLGKTYAWWMFEVSFKLAYITDVIIYYRENFAIRMDGFKLYVTNTSTIPPDGYLCYEDPDPGLPNITQSIPCNQFGKFIIYYDDKGSQHIPSRYDGPVVELCYVAINGCPKGFWGSNCEQKCSTNCIERHCNPTNGSCVWGCKERRTGNYCSKYNIAYDSLVRQSPSGSQPANLTTDGNFGSCSKIQGPTVMFQIDLAKQCIVTGVHITIGACDGGFYGNNCLKICSSFCMYQPCDHGTGECHGGCVRGLQGFNCSQGARSKTSLKQRQKDNVTQNSQKYASHDNQLNDNVRMENVSPYEDLTNDSTSGVYDQINTTYVNN
ncbi:unnamed protein product [Mytilus edulis]|uniref:Uncharacterized protein n=1 Tax=Mytilus edulis TaxID=6550 RepID=A0A8S3QP23_MYTED|nr:unnamed protein product [Mytilus edulis]